MAPKSNDLSLNQTVHSPSSMSGSLFLFLPNFRDNPRPWAMRITSQSVGRDLSASMWVMAALLTPICWARALADMPCLSRSAFKARTTCLSKGSDWLGGGYATFDFSRCLNIRIGNMLPIKRRSQAAFDLWINLIASETTSNFLRPVLAGLSPPQTKLFNDLLPLRLCHRPCGIRNLL
ncbi:hypothetical protein HNQ64_000399 [Prosthecobacter dejongeii]|uniref:Uncharacterized protein n=1 Tax=Prosthecobacter dejongeii TaxID=48465 RepID=A0A7W7YHW2_9BACT|nr:hypothetical protein [Prosthecobacter dejongeii]